jgi:threonine dehydrogenase-like Zn-dependent dehydrogenase
MCGQARGAAVGDATSVEVQSKSLVSAESPMPGAAGMTDLHPTGELSGLRVAVVGLGYVGLPTALSLAGQGAEIIGVDLDESRLSDIKAARVDLLPRDKARLRARKLITR